MLLLRVTRGHVAPGGCDGLFSSRIRPLNISNLTRTCGIRIYQTSTSAVLGCGFMCKDVIVLTLSSCDLPSSPVRGQRLDLRRGGSLFVFQQSDGVMLLDSVTAVNEF